MFRPVHIGVLCAGIALAACSPAYPEFGEAAYRMEGVARAPDGESAPLTVFRDGAMMRVETTLPEYGRVIVVYDPESGAAYALDPPVRSTDAPELPPSGMPGAPTVAAVAAPATLVVDEETRIAGLAMRIDDAKAPQPLEMRWAVLEGQAQSVGGCRVAGERGHEWAAGGERPEDSRVACITRDGIVLRIRTENAVLFEATRLKRGPQSAALFGVPAGYDRIDRAPLDALRPDDTGIDTVAQAPDQAPNPPAP